MTETLSDEQAETPLQDALIAFTGCVGESLDDMCSYGLTIGDSYVPFSPDPTDDCTDDMIQCSQAWVRVMHITPKQGQAESWEGDCAILLEASLEVGVLRCFDIIEHGEAPTASEVLAASMQSMDDMLAIHKAAMGCEVWESISTGQWSPVGPLGGQYGGIWNFTVEIDPGVNC